MLMSRITSECSTLTLLNILSGAAELIDSLQGFRYPL